MFKNEILKILAIAIIVISFIMAFAVYQSPCFPDMMVSHWNMQSQADGYMPKLWGIFLMPIMSAFLFLLFVFLPKTDPLKENYQGFRRYYDGFIFLVIAFLFYPYLLTIAEKHNKQFYDYDAVEAYWIGNDLLDALEFNQVCQNHTLGEPF